MPVYPTYPGVYIEEIPSGVRTIMGVSTSVAAFVGYTREGPLNKATKIYDFASFERKFGGLDKDSELSYAVQQFFQNDGKEAWIVRVSMGAVKASLTLKTGIEANAQKTLLVTAKTEGRWGNDLQLDVDYDTTNPDSTFNLTVTRYKLQGTERRVESVEPYKNLSMDSKSSTYVEKVVNASSQLIEVSRDKTIDLTTLKSGWSLSGDISNALKDLNDNTRFISIIVDGDGPYEVPIYEEGATPNIPDDLVSKINDSLNKIKGGFVVERTDILGTKSLTGNHLKLISGATIGKREQSSVCILNASNKNASKILKLGLMNGGRERESAAELRPCQTGTVSVDLVEEKDDLLKKLNKIKNRPDVNEQKVEVTVSVNIGNKEKISPNPQQFSLDTNISSLTQLANILQEWVQKMDPKNPIFKQAKVQLIGTRLRVVSGSDSPDSTIEELKISDPKNPVTILLKLSSATKSFINVKRYSVGKDIGAQASGDLGDDGRFPVDSSGVQYYRGDSKNKTGLYALEDADIFNILCIPDTTSMDDNSGSEIVSEAIGYCESKRAFFIVDPPRTVNSVEDIKNWAEKLPFSNHAALYYPALMIADPLDQYRLKMFPPSGTVAGLYARTDGSRGVWKAPAGIEATLKNVRGMHYLLTDMENGDLNKLAINCLRNFKGYGNICWGARTLDGSDQRTSEWKYIPVRRLALFIEESLFRGSKWVVFEPNDEPLWAQIRLNFGAFMHNLFRQGAFMGKTPREAYFVKCDAETTTQNDIDRGIVNIVVGFAQLKPAEFVIIKIQQIAGEIQT